MDERATNRLMGTVDAYPAVSDPGRLRAERRPTDAHGPHDTADMINVFRAIAARIDVVLDGSVAADGDPDTDRSAARVTPPEAGNSQQAPASDVPRHRLSTKVLRMSAAGRLDVDERTHEASDGAPKSVSAPSTVAIVAAPDDALPSPVPAVSDRADVEGRLRAARERLVRRRARAVMGRAEAQAPTSRGLRPSGWRRSEIRTWIRRALIGFAIVGASAVVSVLVT